MQYNAMGYNGMGYYEMGLNGMGWDVAHTYRGMYVDESQVQHKTRQDKRILRSINAMQCNGIR